MLNKSQPTMYSPAVWIRFLLLVCVVGSGMWITACASAGIGEALVSDRLYFGRSIPGAGTVTADAWNSFLAEVVTPRFPEGLTWWDVHGQWREKEGAIVREDSFVLEVVHAPSPVADTLVSTVVNHYKTRFRQESVLWVRSAVRAQF